MELTPPGQLFRADFRSGQQPENPSGTIKLLQWNMERGYQLPGIIEELRRINADILSLQEVDVGCDRSGGADTGLEIAKALGLNYAFLCEFEELRSPLRDARSQGGGVHGNAILSKYDFTDVAVVRHRPPSILQDAPSGLEQPGTPAGEAGASARRARCSARHRRHAAGPFGRLQRPPGGVLRSAGAHRPAVRHLCRRAGDGGRRLPAPDHPGRHEHDGARHRPAVPQLLLRPHAVQEHRHGRGDGVAPPCAACAGHSIRPERRQQWQHRQQHQCWQRHVWHQGQQQHGSRGWGQHRCSRGRPGVKCTGASIGGRAAPGRASAAAGAGAPGAANAGGSTAGGTAAGGPSAAAAAAGRPSPTEPQAAGVGAERAGGQRCHQPGVLRPL